MLNILRTGVITKRQGFFITIFIVCAYVIPYYEWVKYATGSKYLFVIFLFSAILLFLRKIEAGTKAELLYFEGSTGTFWSDGFCFIPSVVPVLNYINLSVWNLKQEFDERTMNYSPNVNIEHFFDQKRASYKINADTSVWKLGVHQLISGLFFLYFGLGKNKELIYQSIGIRIMIPALIAGLAVTSLGSNSPTNLEGRATIYEMVNTPFKGVENVSSYIYDKIKGLGKYVRWEKFQ